MSSSGLLEKRLVVVTGKGGVGKSTVAAALGLRAAGQGRRTIVAEIGGRGDVERMFGARESTAAEREVAPGLFTIAIDPGRALEEYLADQLPARALADLLASSRTFGYLTAATPGLRELLCIGKVWDLAQPRRRAGGGRNSDLVLLSIPAPEHGTALLAAPRTS
ncbi:MAG: ArsA-related P-loop ATPase, partial [Solirubrobacteraceae bacterium]